VHQKGIMKLFTLFLLCICACAVYADVDEDKQNVAQVLRETTSVIPLEVNAPTYPLKALRRGIEGWVVLRFVVKEDGTTDDIEVFESSIDDYFDEAAIRATRGRIYQPATINGKPVMQGNVFLRSIFQIKNSDGGVSKPFLSTYRDASKALDNDDLDLAKSLIDKLDAKEKRLLAEVCYLDMLKARYFSKTGDNKATLRHVERALVIADDVASNPIYIHLLRQAIVDNGRANNYQASLKHYEILLETDKKLAPDDPVHDYIKRVKQALNSDAPILSMGEVSHSCKTCEDTVGFWRHVLNRNHFYVDQVVGQLSEITIVCQNSSVTVGFSPETAWTVNKDGGDCSVKVFGEKETTFRLVELANES